MHVVPREAARDGTPHYPAERGAPWPPDPGARPPGRLPVTVTTRNGQTGVAAPRHTGPP
jgi:hypothetical protein